MKNLILALCTLVGVQSFASNTLVRYNYNQGFVAHPVHAVLSILDSGEVILAKTDIRGARTETSTVAALSAPVVENIKVMIATLRADAKMSDLDAGRPMCSDAPYMVVAVIKGGADLEIAKKASCHNFEVQGSFEAGVLANLIESLAAVSINSL